MRFPRVVVPGYPHHVLQRGNRKSDIFGDDSDHLVYLRLLRDACKDHATSVLEYTLMDNHVHLILIPEKADSLAKTIKEAHGEYTGYLNTKYGLVGAEDYLWSSAPARCGLRDDGLITKMHPLVQEISNWSEWLKVEDKKASDLIRRHTRTGRPLGSEQFVRRLEDQLGRKLLPQKRGPRPNQVLRRLKNHESEKTETPSLFR